MGDVAALSRAALSRAALSRAALSRAESNPELRRQKSEGLEERGA